jgi:hypothetical protein
MQSFDASSYGKDFLDNGLKSVESLSKGLQSIAAEATDYTRKSVEDGSAVFEKMIGAKSVEKAIEIQTDYARKAYEGFVAGATKMSELYAEVARDAYKPFESIVAKNK